MFAIESPAFAFNARFFGRNRRVNSRNDEVMDRKLDPNGAIVEALGQMLPSTAAEIAEAAGLDPVVTAARLDDLADRYRVMFNPLTKRYSLPKGTTITGIAA